MSKGRIPTRHTANEKALTSHVVLQIFRPAPLHWGPQMRLPFSAPLLRANPARLCGPISRPTVVCSRCRFPYGAVHVGSQSGDSRPGTSYKPWNSRGKSFFYVCPCRSQFDRRSVWIIASTVIQKRNAMQNSGDLASCMWFPSLASSRLQSIYQCSESTNLAAVQGRSWYLRTYMTV